MATDFYKFGQWLDKSEQYLSDNQCICAGFITLMQYQDPGAWPEVPTLDEAIYSIAGFHPKAVTQAHIDQLEQDVGLDSGGMGKRLTLQPVQVGPSAPLARDERRDMVTAELLVGRGIKESSLLNWRKRRVKAITNLVTTLPHCVATPTGQLANLTPQWCDALAPVVVEYALAVFGHTDFWGYERLDSAERKYDTVRQRLIEHGRAFECLSINTGAEQLLKRAAFAQWLFWMPHFINRTEGVQYLVLSKATVTDLSRLFGCESAF